MKNTILRISFALTLSLCAFGQVASLMPVPRIQFFDANGHPLAGGLVYSYIASTSTPAPTYTDSTATILNTNPVVLDSGGFASIWLGPISYKIVVKNALGGSQYTVDNVSNNVVAGSINSTAYLLNGTNLLDSNLTWTGTQTFNGSTFIGNLSTGTFNPQNMNGILYASATSGVDLGAQTAALWASCGNNCTVFVPSGTWTFSQGISMSTPGQSLVCEGSGQTFLNYTGTGDAIKWQMNPFSIKKAGTLKGCSIVGTSAAANGVHSGSLEGSTWEDLTVSGFTGASANGILLENALISGVQAYTERTYMKNVHVGYSAQVGVIPGNTNGLVFRVNGGTNSFGYGDYEVWLNVESGQTGILVDTGSLIYHNTWNIQGNVDQVPSSALTVKGTINQSPINVLLESVAGSHVNAIHVTATGILNTPGHVLIGSGDVASTGGNIEPTIDAGGFYSVNPWQTLDYPGTTDISLTPMLPMIETGWQLINADGAIVVAQGKGSGSFSGDMSGRLILTWPNNTNRAHTLIIDVACSQFETVSCSMNIPVNNDFGGQAVFTNPVMKLSGGVPSVPQIQVTIGNRNGVSQNVIATWYGASPSVAGNLAPTLFPGGAVGVGALVTSGVVSDVNGKMTLNLTDSGNCTMAAGTCTAQTLSKTYIAAPKCFLTWDGTGALAGILKAPSTTTTVTPASSNGADTAHVNWACYGN